MAELRQEASKEGLFKSRIGGTSEGRPLTPARAVIGVRAGPPRSSIHVRAI